MYVVVCCFGVLVMVFYCYFGLWEEFLDVCIDEFCGCLEFLDLGFFWFEYFCVFGCNFRYVLQLMLGVYFYGIKIGLMMLLVFWIFDEVFFVFMDVGIDEVEVWKVYGMIVDYVFYWEQKFEVFYQFEEINGLNGYCIFQFIEDEFEGYFCFVRVFVVVLFVDMEFVYEDQFDVFVCGFESQIGFVVVDE